MLKRINNKLLIIFGIALLLRVVGIKHGFPFIFHPDEPTVVRSALGIRFFPNPEHFDWPHLYIYLNYILYMVFARFRSVVALVGLKPLISKAFPLIWNDNLVFYLVTRLFSAFLGALTVIPVYLTSKFLFNKRAGLVAALAFAAIPFHVWHSHYSLPDVPMVFFLAYGLYFSVRILRESNPVNYVLAGLFIGFAASTKYNGGLCALVVPLAHVFRVLGEKRQRFLDWAHLRNLIYAGLFSVIGFVIGTPYSIFDFKTFSRTDGPKGAFWQFTNVGSVGLSEHFHRFFSSLVIKISENTGFTLLAVFVFVFIISVVKLVKNGLEKKDHPVWLLLISAVVLLWYISGFEKNRSQYYMISYPFIAVVFSYFCTLLVDKFGRRFGNFVVLVLLIPPLLMSVRNVYIYLRDDTRIQFYKWGVEEFKEQDQLIYDNSTLGQVLNRLPVNYYRGEKYISVFESAYLVSSNNNFDPYGQLVFTASNYLRKGPNIKVYKINRQ